MSLENIESLVIEHLHAIRADVSIVKDDVKEIKNRLANLESGQGSLMQHIGHQSSVSAQQQLSYDRILERIEKLERRLELS